MANLDDLETWGPQECREPRQSPGYKDDPESRDGEG